MKIKPLDEQKAWIRRPVLIISTPIYFLYGFFVYLYYHGNPLFGGLRMVKDMFIYCW